MSHSRCRICPTTLPSPTSPRPSFSGSPALNAELGNPGLDRLSKHSQPASQVDSASQPRTASTARQHSQPAKPASKARATSQLSQPAQATLLASRHDQHVQPAEKTAKTAKDQKSKRLTLVMPVLMLHARLLCSPARRRQPPQSSHRKRPNRRLRSHGEHNQACIAMAALSNL